MLKTVFDVDSYINLKSVNIGGLTKKLSKIKR